MTTFHFILTLVPPIKRFRLRLTISPLRVRQVLATSNGTPRIRNPRGLTFSSLWDQDGKFTEKLSVKAIFLLLELLKFSLYYLGRKPIPFPREWTLPPRQTTSSELPVVGVGGQYVPLIDSHWR